MLNPLFYAVLLTLSASPVEPAAPAMPRVIVAKDKRSFALEPSGRAFIPWGFNYDHDPKGRLLEDYWETEWPRVERDFWTMKKLGANVVRIHLQVGKFMTGPDKANDQALARLTMLLELSISLACMTIRKKAKWPRP